MASRRPANPTGSAFPADMVKALSGKAGVSFEPGWGSSNLVAKCRGKLFILLVQGELVFKLPRERVEELLASGGRRFDPRKNGQLMKEWVVLPLAHRARAKLAVEALGFAHAAK
jgi:hypothetical protein